MIPDESRCTAKAKGSGGRCKNPIIPPTTVCHYHGGRSLRGIAHPRFKAGAKRSKHSKYLPSRLHRDYAKAVSDRRLLSLRNQLALLEAREMELVRGLNPDNDPTKYVETWKDLRELIQERAKLVQAEQKRLQDLGGTMTK